ncbi:HNH endonuclease family protein [Streptomyces achromogenes]|uniref:HNH endonuclease family protein n=1 Tax=Streptomyces achromogenes TaxID=67255 RepID=UPI0036AEFE67
MRDAPAALPVRDENRTGYERTKFKHWVDADKDGCTTRAEVLKTETVTAPEQGTSCRLSGDRWYAPYDDRYFTGPSGLDIDHLVPLAEAWDLGAFAWPPAEREAYANDLGDEWALIAVSAASNRSKADQDPTTWLPPATGYRCQYVTDGVADKTRWGPSTELRRGSRPVPGPQPLPQRAGHRHPRPVGPGRRGPGTGWSVRHRQIGGCNPRGGRTGTAAYSGVRLDVVLTDRGMDGWCGCSWSISVAVVLRKVTCSGR